MKFMAVITLYGNRPYTFPRKILRNILGFSTATVRLCLGNTAGSLRIGDGLDHHRPFCYRLSICPLSPLDQCLLKVHSWSDYVTIGLALALHSDKGRDWIDMAKVLEHEWNILGLQPVGKTRRGVLTFAAWTGRIWSCML